MLWARYSFSFVSIEHYFIVIKKHHNNCFSKNITGSKFLYAYNIVDL
jgi:hypothetical protein